MKVKDMNNVVIKIGDRVKKHTIINDSGSDYKISTVKHIAAMHMGGNLMIWAGSGGAHHPKACGEV